MVEEKNLKQSETNTTLSVVGDGTYTNGARKWSRVCWTKQKLVVVNEAGRVRQ